MKILVVFGTRPETIKMALLVQMLKDTPGVNTRLCVTAQHRMMLDQVLDLFNLVPDYDLNIMTPRQDLTDITCSALSGLREILTDYLPDLILVQGDTTTTFAATLAAYYARIPVHHVEAGLRTGDIYSPWPEEINRKITSTIAVKHYAPTPLAKNNLIAEGVNEETIKVTGNTVVDSLLAISDMLDSTDKLKDSCEKQFHFLNSEKRLILVTGHRRESFGQGFENICNALLRIAELNDIQIIYPVHLNPNVQEPVNRLLSNTGNIHLIPPLEYLPFLYLMKRSTLVITDSGGIQEEAPSLGIPVLVTRDTTERPEAVIAGTVKLVGTDSEAIVAEAEKLLEDTVYYEQMSIAHNPYGDGKACERIIEDILSSYAHTIKE